MLWPQATMNYVQFLVTRDIQMAQKANQMIIACPEGQTIFEDLGIKPQLRSYGVTSDIVTWLLPEFWQQGSLKCHRLWPQKTEVALVHKQPLFDLSNVLALKTISWVTVGIQSGLQSHKLTFLATLIASGWQGVSFLFRLESTVVRSENRCYSMHIHLIFLY